jgi:hypothetical protein
LGKTSEIDIIAHLDEHWYGVYAALLAMSYIASRFGQKALFSTLTVLK